MMEQFLSGAIADSILFFVLLLVSAFTYVYGQKLIKWAGDNKTYNIKLVLTPVRKRRK